MSWRRGEWKEREYVFAEQAGDGNLTTTNFMTMVRNKEWKLVHFLDEPWGQLFDLKADPQEVRNLWALTAHDAKKQELLAALREWRIRSQYNTSGWPSRWR